MTLIDQRPVEIQMRLIPGHWEGNLIIGKGNLSQVGTLVERTTLFVALVRLTSSKADVTAQIFTEILNRFDSQLRRSMTFDQGSEMRNYKLLTKNTGVDVYFAHPHAPWERGISENTNGLLRQYLPKAQTSPCSPRISWTISHGALTPAQERLWDGKPPPNCSSLKELSTSFNIGQLKSHLLHLHLESAVPHP